MKKVLIAILSAVIAASSGAIAVSAVNKDESVMQNDYLTLYVGQEEYNLGRFQLSTGKGDLDNKLDDGKNLMYENFYSSFTTVVINGASFRFGEGKTVSDPYYDSKTDSYITVQRFGDVEVKQTLSFADGMKTGHDDMLLITYSVKNTGEADVLFGLRIMLDSELDKDDKCTLTVDDEYLNFEKEFKDTIPVMWSVVNESKTVTAYGKILTEPDRIDFADWASLYDKKWNYTVDSSKDITDSAAALIWDNSTIAGGAIKEFSVYYGVKNKSEKDDPSEESSKTGESSKTEESSKAENSRVSGPSPSDDNVMTGDSTNIIAALSSVLISSAAITVFLKKRRNK